MLWSLLGLKRAITLLFDHFLGIFCILRHALKRAPCYCCAVGPRCFMNSLSIPSIPAALLDLSCFTYVVSSSRVKGGKVPAPVQRAASIDLFWLVFFVAVLCCLADHILSVGEQLDLELPQLVSGVVYSQSSAWGWLPMLSCCYGSYLCILRGYAIVDVAFGLVKERSVSPSEMVSWSKGSSSYLKVYSS